MMKAGESMDTAAVIEKKKTEIREIAAKDGARCWLYVVTGGSRSGGFKSRSKTPCG
jgi:hypothetical protein